MLRRLALVLESIKFPHSIFALPFALLSMVVAADGWPSARIFGLIILCMIGARSAAMAFNRLADREFDAANPRTRQRPTVTGAVSAPFLAAFILVNCGICFAGAWLLNWACFVWSPAALVILLAYSFSKRFTVLCHFWLGLSLGLAPIGAHLAVQGNLVPLPHLGLRWNLPFEAFPVLLAVAVLLWTAGFDLIYACQDYAADCADTRLCSLPKRIGIGRALALSAILHIAALLLLSAAGIYAGLGPWYWAALALTAALLAYEHWIVRPSDLSRVNVAFFTVNGIVSLLLFGAVVAERVWGKMPELPEVETVARALRQCLPGRRITGVTVLRQTAVAGSPRKPACMVGRRIEEVKRRGKFICVGLEGGFGLLIHLRMTGWLGVRPAGQAPTPRDAHVRVRVALDGGDDCLLFRDQRTFGRIWCGPLEALQATAAWTKLGPEPLEIDAETFVRRLRAQGRTLKPLLLDQRFLAGLGNIYVDESLFAAGLHPLRKARTVSGPRARALHAAIRRILRAAIKAGGTTVDNFFHPNGQTGWFQRKLKAYGREGKACVRCGTAIKRIVVGQRGTWFCPRCQR